MTVEGERRALDLRQHELRICAEAPRQKEERTTMKLITWGALAATAFVALALVAGKDDIRRLRRIYSM